jgi:hypothetical protein
LVSLFNSIQAEPFKIPEDDGNDLMHTFFNPDKEGAWFIFSNSVKKLLIIFFFNFRMALETRRPL